MAKQINPFVENIVMGLLSTLGEPGLETLLQKLVDKDKTKAKTVLTVFRNAARDVAKNNGIKI